MASHLDNIPSEYIPIGASPNDRPIARDELGRITYQGITGLKYTIDPSWRQKPVERSLSNIPRNISTAGRVVGSVAREARTAAREWLRDPSLPSASQVAKTVVGAVESSTEAGRRVLEGEATYGELPLIAAGGVSPRGSIIRRRESSVKIPVLEGEILDEDFELPENFNFVPEPEPTPPANPVVPQELKPVLNTTVRNTPATVLKVQENSFNPKYNPVFGQEVDDIQLGRVDFYNPIINSLQDLNFDKRPLTGREISKFIETKSVGYRAAIARSMSSGRQLFEPDRTYTRAEATKILQDSENRFRSSLSPNPSYETYQRLPEGDNFRNITYREYALQAEPDARGGRILPLNTHAIGDDNDLAHMRASIRSTPDGEVFAIEEIQSDAFTSGVKTPANIEKTTQELNRYKNLLIANIEDLRNARKLPSEVTPESIDRVEEFYKWINIDNAVDGSLYNTYIKFLMETKGIGRREANNLFDDDYSVIPRDSEFNQIDFSTNAKLLPIESVTDYVRPMVNTAIVEAKREGIDRVFIPDSTTILEARSGQMLDPDKARAVYDNGVRKVLGELYREQGVEIKVTPVSFMTGSGKRISFETEMPNAAGLYNTMDTIIEDWTDNKIVLTTEQIDKVFKLQDELVNEIRMPDLGAMTFQEALDDGYEAIDLVEDKTQGYYDLLKDALGNDLLETYDRLPDEFLSTGGTGPAPISGYMLELGNIPTNTKVRFAKGGLVKSEYQRGILKPFALDKNEWIDDNDEVHVLSPEEAKEAYREYFKKDR